MCNSTANFISDTVNSFVDSNLRGFGKKKIFSCVPCCYELEYRSGEVYSIKHYVIKFVSDLRQVGSFLLGTPVSSTNKTDCHDITEILLKVALNIITPLTTARDTRKYFFFTKTTQIGIHE
jgi:hypothetical protein